MYLFYTTWCDFQFGARCSGSINAVLRCWVTRCLHEARCIRSFRYIGGARFGDHNHCSLLILLPLLLLMKNRWRHARKVMHCYERQRHSPAGRDRSWSSCSCDRSESSKWTRNNVSPKHISGYKGGNASSRHGGRDKLWSSRPGRWAIFVLLIYLWEWWTTTRRIRTTRSSASTNNLSTKKWMTLCRRLAASHDREWISHRPGIGSVQKILGSTNVLLLQNTY